MHIHTKAKNGGANDFGRAQDPPLRLWGRWNNNIMIVILYVCGQSLKFDSSKVDSSCETDKI